MVTLGVHGLRTEVSWLSLRVGIHLALLYVPLQLTLNTVRNRFLHKFLLIFPRRHSKCSRFLSGWLAVGSVVRSFTINSQTLLGIDSYINSYLFFPGATVNVLAF